MATQADIRRIALSLAATEQEPRRFALAVRNKGKLKGFFWSWMERATHSASSVVKGMCRLFGTLARSIAVLILVGFSGASAQTGEFRNVRPLEFHLAESAPAPGLVAATNAADATVLYLHRKIELDDRDVKAAAVVAGPDGRPAVQMKLTAAGARKLNALAGKYGARFQRVAITSAHRIVSAPYLEGGTVGDSLDILGQFTQMEAVALAHALTAGRHK